VNGNVIGAWRELSKTSGYGVVAVTPPIDSEDGFDRGRRERELVEPLLGADDDDLGNFAGVEKRLNRMLEDGFSEKWSEKFIKSHSAAGAGCDDDGCKVHRMKMG
jgi:hypothetical protein